VKPTVLSRCLVIAKKLATSNKRNYLQRFATKRNDLQRFATILPKIPQSCRKFPKTQRCDPFLKEWSLKHDFEQLEWAQFELQVHFIFAERLSRADRRLLTLPSPLQDYKVNISLRFGEFWSCFFGSIFKLRVLPGAMRKSVSGERL
jgi:hypothetical protein